MPSSLLGKVKNMSKSMSKLKEKSGNDKAGKKKAKVKRRKNSGPNNTGRKRPKRSCTAQNEDPGLSAGDEAIVFVKECGYSQTAKGAVLAVVHAAPTKDNPQYQLILQDRRSKKGGTHIISRNPNRDAILSVLKAPTKGDPLPPGAGDILGLHDGVNVDDFLVENAYPLGVHQPNVDSRYLETANGRGGHTFEELAALIRHHPFFQALCTSGSAIVSVAKVHPRTERVAVHTGSDKKVLIAIANLDKDNQLVGVCQDFIDELDKLNTLADLAGTDINLKGLLSFDWSKGEGGFSSFIFMICKKEVQAVPSTTNEIDAICICITQDWGVFIVAFGVGKKTRSEGFGTYLVLQLPFLLRDYLGHRRGASYQMPVVLLTQPGDDCGIGLYLRRRFCVGTNTEEHPDVQELTDLISFMSGDDKRPVAVRCTHNFISDGIRSHAPPLEDGKGESYETRSLGIGGPITVGESLSGCETVGDETSSECGEDKAFEVTDDNESNGDGEEEGGKEDSKLSDDNEEEEVIEEKIEEDLAARAARALVIATGKDANGGDDSDGVGTTGGEGGDGGGVNDGDANGGDATVGDGRDSGRSGNRAGGPFFTPNSTTLKRARLLVREDNDSGEMRETAVGPEEQQQSVVHVAIPNSSFSAIAIGRNGRCSFAAEERSRLEVVSGEICLSQGSGTRRVAPGKSYRLDGVIDLTNGGMDDAVVVYETGPFIVADRTIECVPIVDRSNKHADLSDACSQILRNFCCKILEHDGKYYVVDSEGTLYSFRDLKSCTRQVRSLMNDSLDEVQEYKIRVKRWRFMLMDKDDERSISAYLDVGLDAGCEYILNELEAFSGADATTPQIQFVGRSTFVG